MEDIVENVSITSDGTLNGFRVRVKENVPVKRISRGDYRNTKLFLMGKV